MRRTILKGTTKAEGGIGCSRHKKCLMKEEKNAGTQQKEKNRAKQKASLKLTTKQIKGYLYLFSMKSLTW